MKCNISELFPGDQELHAEANSLGFSGRRWLRSSAGCLGKVRSDFFFVQTRPTQVRPANPAKQPGTVSFPPSPSQHLLQKLPQALVSQLSGY